MIGIKDGWSGLLKESDIPLNLNTISGILPRGDSILGTSRTNPFKTQDSPCKVLQNTKKAGIDALIAIGGDDIYTVASEMYKLCLN
jgi:6-phosphofructokinase